MRQHYVIVLQKIHGLTKERELVMKLYKAGEVVFKNSRKEWSKFFLEIGEKEKRVIALTADLSRSTCTEDFRKNIPERYFNVGIAEQNMVGMAAGLALEGKIPYCVSFAPFMSMRALEQVRTDICYMNLNARILGIYSGVSQAGSTHSGLEDAGIFRGIPNIAVVVASDVGMVKKIFEASLTHQGPMYIRLSQGSNDCQIYAEDYEFVIGRAIETLPGSDISIISSGTVLSYVTQAAEKLAECGISAQVLDMHTLKPLDRQAVIDAAKKTGRIITVENHFVTNGLGSAVAEVLAEENLSCRFRRLGIPDTFTCNGSNDQLHAKYGFATDSIVNAAKELMR